MTTEYCVIWKLRKEIHIFHGKEEICKKYVILSLYLLFVECDVVDSVWHFSCIKILPKIDYVEKVSSELRRIVSGEIYKWLGYTSFKT